MKQKKKNGELGHVTRIFAAGQGKLRSGFISLRQAKIKRHELFNGVRLQSAGRAACREMNQFLLETFKDFLESDAG